MSNSPKPKPTATMFAFVLACLCLAIIGYTAVSYVNQSLNGLVDDKVDLLIVRQRTALSALAVVTGISAIIMGFALFMISAKGEFAVKADSHWLKGALSSGVPGPFFALCGTVITVVVLTNKVVHETIPPTSGGAGVSDLHYADRTIASPETRLGIYTTNMTVYNILQEIRHSTAPSADREQWLSTNLDKIHIVMVKWPPAATKPTDMTVKDVESASDQYNLANGYLLVGQSDGAGELVSGLRAIDTATKSLAEVSTPESTRSCVDWTEACLLLRKSLESASALVRGQN